MIEYIALGYLIAAISIGFHMFILLKDEVSEEFSFAVPYIIVSSLFWPASAALHLTFYFRSKKNH
jgi:hypothetical protein